MEDRKGESLKARIRAGDIRRQDVLRRLAELAFGSVGDCVRLTLKPDTDIAKLDLSLLSEIRCTEKGGVELKLLDRLKVLEQLAALTETEGDDLEEFLRSMGDEE